MYGTDLTFSDGLNVFWADNSMGKSTCIRSILYALGLDAMLTTSHTEVPLTPAMKWKLEDTGPDISVIESDVYLEIESLEKRRIAIRRTVKGSRNSHLVTVWNGPLLTEPNGKFDSSDYYVAWRNAATRERGFHQFLATFLGWKLPEVVTYDGRVVPLYLECIFPFILVEQTRGWSSLQPPVPTHYRIRDVHKRALEFILDLDAHRIASIRLALADEERRIAKRWEVLTEECNVVAGLVFGIAQAIPDTPISVWPPPVSPVITVFQANVWISLAQAVDESRAALDKLLGEEIPRVADITNAASTSLVDAEATLKSREALISRLINTLELENAEADAVAERLAAIEEDLTRNKDVQTLQRLGSKITASISEGTCPTCHQPIQDSLTPLPNGQSVMPIGDNIRFIEDQRRTFLSVQTNTKRVVQARRQQLLGLRVEANDLRSRIRALRQTLIADGRLPSIAAIESRLKLEKSLETMSKALSEFAGAIAEFEQLAAASAEVRKKIADLPENDTSSSDRAKLGDFATALISQLNQYGFASVHPESVALSYDSYRPEYDGFDLQTSVSASDLIRSIWSYLHGLLEVSRRYPTHHPGLILFDEPKQQSAKDVSFAELLRRASGAIDFAQQVIFATSEKRETLANTLKDIRHNYIEIDGRVLKRLSAS